MGDLTPHLNSLAARFPFTDVHHLAHAARIPGGIATHIAATHHLTVAEARDAVEDVVLLHIAKTGL